MNMRTKDGKRVQILDNEEEPSEEIIDKETGKRRPRKKKYINENGEIEDVDEIVESDEPTEYDPETGKKLPKKRKYINRKGDIFELEEEPSEEKKEPKVIKEIKKPKKMTTENGQKVEIIEDENEPAKVTIDKKTGKKVIKRKIKNENGDIEDIKEIIDEEEPSEIKETKNKEIYK